MRMGTFDHCRVAFAAAAALSFLAHAPVASAQTTPVVPSTSGGGGATVPPGGAATVPPGGAATLPPGGATARLTNATILRLARPLGTDRVYYNDAVCPDAATRSRNDTVIVVFSPCADHVQELTRGAPTSHVEPLNPTLVSLDAAHSSCTDRRWCEELHRLDPEAVFVCVDVGAESRYSVDYVYPEGMNLSRGILLPNRRLAVAARYQPSLGRPTATIDDARVGLEAPVIDVRSRREQPANTQMGDSEPSLPSSCAFDVINSVPSLRSGTVPLTITYRSSATQERTERILLVVEPVYAGAIRFGLSAVFGGAASHQYAAVAAPGSGQREVTLSFSGGAEFELVVGASAFVWDLLSNRGGRTYISRRPWWSYVVPSPYIGIGAVGTLGDKVTAFQSLHLGGEWEFARAFSISATAVLRRTTRLNSGFFVGSPLSSDDVGAFTHGELNWGVGLVVNFSPELLQFATPTVSGR